MPMRGGTHYFFLSSTTSPSLSFSVPFYLSLLSIPNLLNNNNINNRKVETSLGEQNDSRWDEASGVNTTPGDFFIETPLHPTLSISLSLTLFSPPPNGKHTSVIRDFKYTSLLCVYVCVHPFLVNFVAVFEDYDRIYPRCPGAAGVLALCLTPHTCCHLWCVHTPPPLPLRVRGPSP